MKSLSLRKTVAFLLLASSALTFWFSATAYSAAIKGGVPFEDCPVCHKNATTLILTCNSLDYRRHKDHGDPDGECPPSTSSK